MHTTLRHRQPAGIFGLKVDEDKNLSYLRLSAMVGGLRWRLRCPQCKKSKRILINGENRYPKWSMDC